MKKKPIIGVSRGNEFSPNHVGNDAAIFNKVVESLRSQDFRVEVYTEEEFVARNVTADVIFSMARHQAAIHKLLELERQGGVIVNPASGIMNCVRRPMTELLVSNGIPHPKSRIISTSSYVENISFPCWIKRGDSHALVKEDVCYVTGMEQAMKVIDDFRLRNIPVAVVNEHLEGDLIKFYGVRQTGFFYWFYPSPASHSKFGLEVVNGEASGIPFSEQALAEYCERASQVLDVPVYGGDCVVSAQGEVRIIDFNDWPSFARCREEASQSIASYIAVHARKRVKESVFI